MIDFRLSRYYNYTFEGEAFLLQKKLKILLIITISLITATLVAILIITHLGSHYERDLKRIQSGKSDLNIILISIDTLRADHISPYGHNIETPNIQKLADEGTTFMHCGAPTPLTLPSHTSMFTGTYPIRHGAHDNGLLLSDEGNLFLSEILSEHGYDTSAFISSMILSTEFGFNQGFDFFEESIKPPIVSRDADEVLDKVLSYFKDYEGDRFFTFIHFYDPHFPYTPPKEYAKRYKAL